MMVAWIKAADMRMERIRWNLRFKQTLWSGIDTSCWLVRDEGGKRDSQVSGLSDWWMEVTFTGVGNMEASSRVWRKLTSALLNTLSVNCLGHIWVKKSSRPLHEETDFWRHKNMDGLWRHEFEWLQVGLVFEKEVTGGGGTLRSLNS